MTRGRRKSPLVLLLVVTLSSCAFTMNFDELQEGGEPGRGGSVARGGSGAVSAAGDAGAPVGSDGGTPGSAGAAGAAGAPSIALEEAAAALATVLCAKAEDCVGAAAFHALSPIEDCEVSAETGLANTIVANIEQSEQNGTLVYDGSAMPACLEAYEMLPCDEVAIEFPEACKDALAGLAPEGGDCTHGLECESGLYCSSGTCPGTCTAPLQEDDACTDLDVCAPGLTCFEGVCTPLAGEGEDCGGTVLPGCVAAYACFGDNPAMMMPGKCFPYTDVFVLNEGQGCNVFGTPSLCKDGLYCAGGECVGPAESGGPCQAAVPDMCPPGEFCSSGTCTPLPGPNQACRLFTAWYESQCDAYLRCVGFFCRQLAEIGEPCSGPEECYSGACGTSGECVPSACQ